ncbi:metalloregulator ArsR/SmtB family transcription factor [Streptomyces sp. NPDC001941]|uniref:ArsR/SmtB family transcription factor n=1 Tax=Streptomyces sp. NPDC001941 TaxID=3154659 RepID=UPI003330BA7A
MNAQRAEAWDPAAADRAVAVLKAVADPSRYRLLWALTRDELPVSALAELLGAHVAATSQHLAKLRAAGLVVARREGTRIYYRAVPVRGLLDEAVHVAETTVEGAARSGDAAAGAAPSRATGRAAGRRLATGSTSS